MGDWGHCYRAIVRCFVFVGPFLLICIDQHFRPTQELLDLPVKMLFSPKLDILVKHWVESSVCWKNTSSLLFGVNVQLGYIYITNMTPVTTSHRWNTYAIFSSVCSNVVAITVDSQQEGLIVAFIRSLDDVSVPAGCLAHRPTTCTLGWPETWGISVWKNICWLNFDWFGMLMKDDDHDHDIQKWGNLVPACCRAVNRKWRQNSNPI